MLCFVFLIQATSDRNGLFMFNWYRGVPSHEQREKRVEEDIRSTKTCVRDDGEERSKHEYLRHER